MPNRLTLIPLLTGLFIVALFGGGGLLVIARLGAGPTATPLPPHVIVLAAPGETIVAPTHPPSLTPAPPTQAIAARATYDWTLEAYSTATASVTFTGTPAPSNTRGPTSTPSLTPTASATPSPTVTPTSTGLALLNSLGNSYLPTVSARARGIYQYGLSIGNNPGSFARLGDCHSSYPGFLGAFDVEGSYRLGSYGYLQNVINFYSGSFARQSQAAYAGLHMGSFFSPLWAKPDWCEGNENVMDCEYRLFKPSVIFLNIGTLNMASPNEEYERFVRPIIEYWISKGVVPILNTKADNIEGDDRFNIIMRRLAFEYDVPLWDFARAARLLPNNGLQSDNVHLSDGLPNFDDPAQLQTGWTIRNLTGLLALDAVWRGLQ